MSGKLKNRLSTTLVHARLDCTGHSAGSPHSHQTGTVDLTGFHSLMSFDHLVKLKPGSHMMA